MLKVSLFLFLSLDDWNASFLRSGFYVCLRGSPRSLRLLGDLLLIEVVRIDVSQLFLEIKQLLLEPEVRTHDGSFASQVV